MSAPAYPYAASLGSRIGAYVVDALVASLVIGIGYAVVIGGVVGQSEGLVLAGFVLLLVLGLGYPAYYIVSHGRTGGTPGKRMLGIRTVDIDTGQPIGIGRAFVRQLVLGVLGPINLVQLLTIPGHPRRQGWHDAAARSVVVRAELLGRQVVAPSAAVPIAPGPRPAEPWPAPTVPDLASAPPTTPPVAIPKTPTATPSAQVGPPPGEQYAAPGPHTSASTVTPPPGAFQTSAVPMTSPASTPGPWRLTTSGDERELSGALLVGRGPDGGLVAGAATWSVAGTELSVSKTHARFGVDADVAWVEDWHSTNGTVLHRDGRSVPLAPHTRTDLREGDRVDLGDLRVVVSRSWT